MKTKKVLLELFRSNSRSFIKSKVLVLFTLIFLTTGCEKIDIKPGYPTTIKKLPPEILEQLRTEFAQNNVYLKTSLNKFGFCDEFDNRVSATTPPLLEALTEQEATELVKTFVLNNPSATGVINSNDFQLDRVISSSGHDDSVSWHIKSKNQRIDTIEVLHSSIIFHTRNRELNICGGNWFPEVYIPKKFKFDSEIAKLLLKGKDVSHYTFAGDLHTVRITPESLEKSYASLKIFPIWGEDKIELRVAWEINIPSPVSYIIYVDVMNGEILGEYPTFIS